MIKLKASLYNANRLVVLRRMGPVGMWYLFIQKIGKPKSERVTTKLKTHKFPTAGLGVVVENTKLSTLLLTLTSTAFSTTIQRLINLSEGLISTVKYKSTD